MRGWGDPSRGPNVDHWIESCPRPRCTDVWGPPLVLERRLGLRPCLDPVPSRVGRPFYHLLFLGPVPTYVGLTYVHSYSVTSAKHRSQERGVNSIRFLLSFPLYSGP